MFGEGKVCEMGGFNVWIHRDRIEVRDRYGAGSLIGTTDTNGRLIESTVSAAARESSPEPTGRLVERLVHEALGRNLYEIGEYAARIDSRGVRVYDAKDNLMGWCERQEGSCITMVDPSYTDTAVKVAREALRAYNAVTSYSIEHHRVDVTGYGASVFTANGTRIGFSNFAGFILDLPNAANRAAVQHLVNEALTKHYRKNKATL
jgi:hypothetical protein